MNEHVPDKADDESEFHDIAQPDSAIGPASGDPALTCVPEHAAGALVAIVVGLGAAAISWVALRRKRRTGKRGT